MPPVSDFTPNEEDTPDDLKGVKTSRKKKQKKGTKQRAADEYKDSSSEGPKLSPDLLPVLDHANPSPPPSPRPLDAHEQPPLEDDQAAQPPLDREKVPNKLTVSHSEPSPPQDGVLAPAFRLSPNVNNAQHAPSLSSSPQGGIRLPPNNNLDNTHPTSLASANSTPSCDRKTSLIAPSPSPRLGTFYNPPPPHMPQRHFVRRSEMDFVTAEPQRPKTSKGHYCGFDSLEKANAGTSPSANNVVLAGTLNGLDVYRLLPQSASLVGRLQGLRGTVVDAKILPWTERHDPFAALRPLVVCLVHGPARDDQRNIDNPPHEADAALPVSYQTTVDVYSLSSAELLCTLYETPPRPSIAHGVECEPIGDLKIAAEGQFVTVASGTSGEVFVFASYNRPITDHLPLFRCITKLWTSTATIVSSSSSEGSCPQPEENRTVDYKAPVMALSPRWLAIKPPLMSSSQVSLQGSPLLSVSHPDPPGVSSHVSPPPPVVNCEVDAPFNNSFLDRVAKQATQEIRKGAQWVGEQGKQAWKAYWNKPSPPLATDAANHSLRQATQADQGQFPPTHAQNNEPHHSHVEPASISIIDLQKLSDFEDNPVKGALIPLATFVLADGCSFMSFAPEGLSLLVTNHVGDASTIWDLMRITSGKLLSPHAPIAAGGVQYVTAAARFARQTPSIVAGVAWSAHGNRLAILTQKGTVHLHELPSFGLLRPLNTGALGSPYSRTLLPSPGSSPQSETPISGFMTTFRARMQTLPGINLRAPTNPRATVSHASAYARNTGRKALKQGVSMATDTALKFRHHEQTKIRLQSAQQSLCPLSLRWLSGRDNGLIATVIDDRVRLHTVKSNHYEQDKRTVVYLTASKRPVAELFLNATEVASAGWHLNKANIAQRIPSARIKQFSASIVQDKDTSPMTLPFHRTPQVDLFTYPGSSVSTKNGTKTSHSIGHGMGSAEAWVFGLPLHSATKVTSQHVDEEDDLTRAMSDGGLDDLLTEMPESLGNEQFDQAYGESNGPR